MKIGSEIVQAEVAASEIDLAAVLTDAESTMALHTLGPDIAKRLRRAREAAGITIRDLAEKAHTTPRTIQSLLDGRGGGSKVGLLAEIAKALKVSPGWLCFGEGPEPDGLAVKKR